MGEAPRASGRILLVGFRYRRIASLGSSSSTGGLLSSVNGTLGSIVSIDLVRKSSGGIEEVVNVDKDLAAERNARSDAVRLDLKTDLNGVVDGVRLSAGRVGLALKSSLSTSGDTFDNGSSGCSPGGVVTGSRDRRGERSLPPLGVIGKSADGIILGDMESPNDGRLSKDAVRVE